MLSVCSFYQEFGFMICWRTVDCFRPQVRTVDAGLVWHYGTRLSLVDLNSKVDSATMTNSGHVPVPSATGVVEPGIPAGDRAVSDEGL